MNRLKALVAEYGPVAIGVYLVIFGSVLACFATAIHLGMQSFLGFELDSTLGGAGTIGAAWLATKATQPLRIAATLALTPLVGRLVRSRTPEAPSEPEQTTKPREAEA